MNHLPLSSPHLPEVLLKRGTALAEQELLISLKMDPKNPVALNNLLALREAFETGEMPMFGGVYNPRTRQFTDL